MNRFRLQRISRLKEQLRKAVTDEIALLQQDLAGVQQAMADTQAALDRNRVEAARTATEGKSAIELHLHAIFERAQQAAGNALKQRAGEIDDEIAARRTELRERRREERQFETLQARLRQRSAVAEGRAEANFQDELAVRAKRSSSQDGEPTP